MFLNFVNSECVGTAVLLATNSTDGIMHIGRDAVDYFSQSLTGWCFEHGGAILQQVVIDAGLLCFILLAHRQYRFRLELCNCNRTSGDALAYP